MHTSRHRRPFVVMMSFHTSRETRPHLLCMLTCHDILYRHSSQGPYAVRGPTTLAGNTCAWGCTRSNSTEIRDELLAVFIRCAACCCSRAALAAVGLPITPCKLKVDSMGAVFLFGVRIAGAAAWHAQDVARVLLAFRRRIPHRQPPVNVVLPVESRTLSHAEGLLSSFASRPLGIQSFVANEFVYSLLVLYVYRHGYWIRIRLTPLAGSFSLRFCVLLCIAFVVIFLGPCI